MASVPVTLGAASTFAVLGATTVTNTGLTTIIGDVGVSPGPSITGFPPGVVTGGSIYQNVPPAVQAHSDAATAYGVLAGEVPTTDLSGQDLGGLTLAPGVYHFSTSAQLTGILTLDAQGNPAARFDFQMGTTLTTAGLSSILLINGAQDNNVFFQVGSSATLGANTAFKGTILANTSITLTTGASMVHGRALAVNGAVTLDTNNLSVPVNPVPVLATIDPASTPESQNPLTLTVTGSNFVPSSVVQFNGAPLTTTFVSSTQLQALVPAADVGEEGVAAITVFSPAPGGGTSNPARLTITDPAVSATGGFVLTPPFGGATGNQTVATFTDPAGAEPNAIDPTPGIPSHYAATVNWGDGTPSTPGTITFNAGVFTVSGNHTYTARSGNFTITVTINHENAPPVTVTSTAAVGDAPLAASPVPVFGTEGAPLTNVDVATFTDPDPSSSAGDFAATINWGDGTPTTAGTIVRDASGTYHVQGSHTYTEESKPTIPIVVSIIDNAGGSTATATSPATIKQSPLLPVASAVVATEGAALAAGTPLASFTDTGGADPVGDYTATINWGDGAPTTAATVSLLGNGGNFAVTSATPHTYAEEGIYAITVTITDNDPTNPNGVPTSAMTTSTATVQDAALTAVASPAIPTAVEGKAFTAQVASFTDANPAAPVTDFTATIDWGDGTPVVTGLVGSLGGGLFNVAGTHTYAEAGTYTVTSLVKDDGGQTTTGSTTVTVADAPLLAGTGLPIAAVQNQPLVNVPVATFTDTNPLATAADFTATITWGDLSPPDTNTRVMLTGGTAAGAIFTVYGSHTYATPGTFTAGVTVLDEDGASITTPISTIVTVAPSPLLITTTSIQATEGLALPNAQATGPPGFQLVPAGATVVATFTDNAVPAPIGAFTATIDFGNGQVVAGSIAQNGSNFFVLAPASPPIVYPDEGTYTFRVTITQADPMAPSGFLTAIAVGTATVADAPLSVAGVQPPALTGTQQTPIGPIALASFADANPLATTADFTATIDWGDGTPQSAGTVTGSVGGPFTVNGTHTYAQPSPAGTPYKITILVKDDGGQQVNLSTTATVNASTLVGTPVTINEVESVPFNNVVVAYFTDNSGTAGPLSSYSATINWGIPGPGATTIGQIVPLGGNQFAVLGSFTYPEESGPPSLPAPYTITVSISHNGTPAITVQSSALVSDAPLTGTAVPIFATEGAPFTGTVAFFTDTDPGTVGDPTNNPADYTATITWGDGSTSFGTIVSAGGSSFTVNGVLPPAGPGHSFPEEGSFPFSVTIKDTGGATLTVFSTATIADAALTAAPVTTTAPESPAFTGTVATFTDADPAGTLADYTATINWGDGVTTPGTIINNPSGPGFVVNGTHLYEEGTYLVTVQIKDVGGATTQTVSTIIITDSPLTAGPVTAITAVEGVPFSLQVGTFTDADLLGVIADFSSTISWGDGSSSAGIIGQLANGTFTVTGTHTYAEETTVPLPITITIKDIGGSTTTATATATVLDAPLTAQGTTIQGIEGLPLAAGPIGNGLLVATIQDSDPLASVTDFTTGTGSITLDWGDGSPLVTIPAANITAVGSAAGVTFKVFGGPHVYAEEGSYKITVTATDAGGATTVAHSEADIADAALSPAAVQPVIGPLSGVASFTVPVATFVDANPAGTVDDFTATIDWGDGTPRSTGTISQPGGPGTTFLVTGSHNYVNPFVNGGAGRFPIIVNVYDKGGATTVVVNTALVNPIPVVLTGQLDPASDSGKFHTDAITNINQPRFFGSAEPFSTVQLYAVPAGTTNPFLIGQTQTDGSGAWAIVSSRLSDGSYTIFAKETNRSGVATIATQVLPNAAQGPLVIDTVGPRITFASFDRVTSTANFTFVDVNQALAPGGSGLLVQSLVDSANYALKQIVKVRGHRSLRPLVVTNINVTPGGDPFTANVSLTFNNGAYLVGGLFQVIARAESALLTGGIQDVAGNALDGEFYGPTSSTGNGLPGGDFVANFTIIHRGNSGPQTIVGFPHPNDPPAHFPTFTRTRRNPSRGKSVKAAAVSTVSSAPSASVAMHDAALAGVVVKKKH